MNGFGGFFKQREFWTCRQRKVSNPFKKFFSKEVTFFQTLNISEGCSSLTNITAAPYGAVRNKDYRINWVSVPNNVLCVGTG